MMSLTVSSICQSFICQRQTPLGTRHSRRISSIRHQAMICYSLYDRIGKRKKRRKRNGSTLIFFFVSESLPVEERLFVRRWNAEKRDLPNATATQVDWEATYFLNVVIHLEYQLEFKVYRKLKATTTNSTTTNDSSSTTSTTKTSTTTTASTTTSKPASNVEIIYRNQSPIYAAPNRIRLDQSEKASHTEMTFPEIFFTLLDHDINDKDNPPVT